MKISLPVAEPPTTTTITRDPQGNPLTITDADNKVTRFFYNAQGLLTETRDALYPAHPATTFTYDCPVRLSGRAIRLNSPSMFTLTEPISFP